MIERLKELRGVLGLNQRDFSSRINISQPALAMIEKGQRPLRDIYISQICAEFNVNEEWLREGTGDMFVQPDTFSLDDYARKNNLSDLEIDIIKSYMDLDSDVRQRFMSNLQMIFGKHNEVAATSLKESNYTENDIKEEYINEELESYKLELEAEQKGVTLSASEKRKGNAG